MISKIQINPDPDLYDSNGRLIPLNQIPVSTKYVDVAVIIVNQDKPELLSYKIQQLKKFENNLKLEIVVVNISNENFDLSGAFSYSLPDENNISTGQYFSYNLGIRLARYRWNCKYYWLTSNRISIEGNADTLEKLVRISDKNPRLAVLIPNQIDHKHIKKKDSQDDIHLVISGNSETLFVRAEAVEEVGFLNPDFKYKIGAMEEFVYRLFQKNWLVAEYNNFRVKNLLDQNKMQSPGNNLHDAKEFAARYFVEHYGKNWDSDFEKALPSNKIKLSYAKLRHQWECALSDNERKIYSPPKKTEPSLENKIEALHPWYYSLEIGGIIVIPGIGSKQSAEELNNRTKYRSKLMVNEVAKRYNFKNKKILDVGSNCGYWSSRYAELGAKSMLAVEGRVEFVNQGRLYWENNQFMTKNSYEFIKGNIMDPVIWEKIKEKNTFDFTLCAGILYHIPHYEDLIKFIASVTKEAILIDTRVSDDNRYIKEPGGWCFDSIVETRTKRIPNLNTLIKLLDILCFKTELLTINDPIPIGLKGNDDYSRGKRIVLLATK